MDPLLKVCDTTTQDENIRVKIYTLVTPDQSCVLWVQLPLIWSPLVRPQYKIQMNGHWHCHA